jgi:hypothetical protein
VKIRTLFVSGDIGGAKAVKPVIEKGSLYDVMPLIVTHRDLNNLVNSSIGRLDIPDSTSVEKAKEILKKENIDVLVFTTSVKDLFPLKLAKAAKGANIPTVCILDNWMNYGKRLIFEDLEMLYPEIYAVMDKYAFTEAVKDKVPQEILSITGQPALEDMLVEYNEWKQRADRRSFLKGIGLDPDKKVISFISEPVEADQGGEGSPNYRGYTEKVVISKLCNGLQEYSKDVQILLIPHPREDINGLAKEWESNKGTLKGIISNSLTGREAVFFSDAVTGMASILLYEAWLIGKPVASFQPNLRNEHLTLLKNKKGALTITDNSLWTGTISKLISDIKDNGQNKVNDELLLHANAAQNICKLIYDLGRRQ